MVAEVLDVGNPSDVVRCVVAELSEWYATLVRMADMARRSADRQAQIVVRMSPAEREALRAAAERSGTTVTDLVRDRVSDLIGAGA